MGDDDGDLGLSRAHFGQLLGLECADRDAAPCYFFEAGDDLLESLAGNPSRDPLDRAGRGEILLHGIDRHVEVEVVEEGLHEPARMGAELFLPLFQCRKGPFGKGKALRNGRQDLRRDSLEILRELRLLESHLLQLGIQRPAAFLGGNRHDKAGPAEGHDKGPLFQKPGELRDAFRLDRTKPEGEVGEMFQLVEGHLQVGESRKLFRRLLEVELLLKEAALLFYHAGKPVDELLGRLDELAPLHGRGGGRPGAGSRDAEETGHGLDLSPKVSDLPLFRIDLPLGASLRDELHASGESEIPQHVVHVALEYEKLDFLHALGEHLLHPEESEDLLFRNR